MHGGGVFAVAIPAVVLGGPVLLGLAGLRRGRDDDATAAPPTWRWPVSVQSALLYVLAFNVTFFIQELFLVVPKALTPGLNPVLFHNNHGWSGDHPLENLFQGTGALAILLSGLAFAWLARRSGGRTGALGLFYLWMAFNGLFQALPQFVIGAFVPGNDVGRAMRYFELGDGSRAAIAAAALAAVVLVGLWLVRPMLALASDATELADRRSRSRFAFLIATLPALTAIPLIIAYRVPREFGEVVLPPIVVTVIGVMWLQAGAWRIADARPAETPPGGEMLTPLLLALGLLAFFQLVLRPGIPF